eukprot:Lankesteria_metandrocarpae@DN5021_c0_g1_i2.p1
MNLYAEPSWSAKPPKTYVLEVIREGTLQRRHILGDKAYYVVGSDKDCVDVNYAHPSVSRQHAVLQFNASGEVYVYDFSSNGTRLNKCQVEPRGYHLVKPGDQLTFGASERRTFHFWENDDELNDEDDHDYCDADGGISTEDVIARCSRFDDTESILSSSCSVASEARSPQDSSSEDAGEKLWDTSALTDEEQRLDRFIEFSTGMLNLKRLREEMNLNSSQQRLAANLEKCYADIRRASKPGNPLETADEEELADLEKSADSSLVELANSLDCGRAALSLVKVSRATKRSIEARQFDEADEFFDRTAPEKVRVETSEDLKMRAAALRRELDDTVDEMRTLDAVWAPNTGSGGATDEVCGGDADATEPLDPLDAYMQTLQQTEKGKVQNRKRKLNEEYQQIEATLAGLRDAPKKNQH